MVKVVANSSPLIFLAKLQKLDLLHNLFENLTIPQAVYEETVVEGKQHPESRYIKKADWILNYNIKNQRLATFLRQLVDEGEAEAITLSLENDADLLLVDDKDVRKIAKHFGLEITGTIGVLLLAKKKKILTTLQPLISELREEGFRISGNVVKKILQEASKEERNNTN